MSQPIDPAAREELINTVAFSFSPTRRRFVQTLGVGLLIAVLDTPVVAQAVRRVRQSAGAAAESTAPGELTVSARLHIARAGTLTVLTGKVEGGQGARAEITQAAAEELRVAPQALVLLMADTAQVPDDGITAGSRTTPRTLPAVREGCAAARELLRAVACREWNLKPDQVDVKDGKAVETRGPRTMAYADLAALDEKALPQTARPNIAVTPVKDWQALGTSFPRPNARDLVTGTHRYPSDITLPGMLHGKILRPPSFGATLSSIELAPARALPGVTVVHDGNFVGVAAPTSHKAEQAISLLGAMAQWQPHGEHPSSTQLFEHLDRHAGEKAHNPFADEVPNAAQHHQQRYEVAYAQHAPLEPRAACAAWDDGKLTVYTGTQNPFGVRNELMRAFNLGPSEVRVIVPDFGGGFGGKHTGECAVEAARLAHAAGKPVSLRWTREEEFTWAYFRPAALITVEATLDAQHHITTWHFVDINAGGAGIDTPYRIAKAQSQSIGSDGPLRQGSYRALASTANNFARESAMDELAALAGMDPLDFRLAHLENERIRAVLQEAAKRFDWPTRVKRKSNNVGVGLACGTEKGSVVAACVEIEIAGEAIKVRHVCEAFECGAIVNPSNLPSQVQGAIIMGLGPALREAMTFADGSITNPHFMGYQVPRLADVPELDIHLLNRPDLPSVGAGETPIIAVAPAIANAVCHATGKRIRSMPIRLSASA